MERGGARCSAYCTQAKRKEKICQSAQRCISQQDTLRILQGRKQYLLVFIMWSIVYLYCIVVSSVEDFGRTTMLIYMIDRKRQLCLLCCGGDAFKYENINYLILIRLHFHMNDIHRTLIHSSDTFPSDVATTELQDCDFVRWRRGRCQQ